MYNSKLNLRLHTSADLTIFRLWSLEVEEDWPNQVILSFEDDEKNHLLGRFSYFKLNTVNNSAQFSGMIDPTKRNMGLGTEMLRQSMAYFFRQTKLNKLYCEVPATAKTAIRILEKAGFFLEASLREHYYEDGRLHDLLIYSIFRREWMND